MTTQRGSRAALRTQRAAPIMIVRAGLACGLFLAFAQIANASQILTRNSTLSTVGGRRRSLFFLPFGRFMCAKSGMKGYSSKMSLQFGLVLHWKATKSKTIMFAIQARKGSAAYKAGWFAAGWSPDGGMGGSNVIAYESGTGAAAPYDCIQQSAAVPATSWAPPTSVSTGKHGIIVKFTRSSSDGSSVKVYNSGGMHIVFAYGPDSSVALHSDAENAAVDFSCGCGPFRSWC